MTVKLKNSPPEKQDDGSKHLCELQLYFDCVRFVSHMHLRHLDSHKLASVTRSPLRLYIQRVCVCVWAWPRWSFIAKLICARPKQWARTRFLDAAHAAHFCLAAIPSLFCDCDATAPLLVAAAADFCLFWFIMSGQCCAKQPPDAYTQRTLLCARVNLILASKLTLDGEVRMQGRETHALKLKRKYKSLFMVCCFPALAKFCNYVMHNLRPMQQILCDEIISLYKAFIKFDSHSTLRFI